MKNNQISIIVMLAMISSTLCASSYINVPACKGSPQPTIHPFTYTINGTTQNTTQAYMCHDDTYLNVHWFNVDEEVISTLPKCNDPLYTEDAVEIFIATNTSYPNRYFEFEISPKGQLFFAEIYNPNLVCSNLGTNYYPCTSAIYTAKITQKGWQADLKIDLTLIGRGKKQSVYLGNIFRIDKSKTKPTRYLSFNPTMSSPACFHQPLKFIQFRLI